VKDRRLDVPGPAARQRNGRFVSCHETCLQLLNGRNPVPADPVRSRATDARWPQQDHLHKAGDAGCGLFLGRESAPGAGT
jgi:hypothetical protein